MCTPLCKKSELQRLKARLCATFWPYQRAFYLWFDPLLTADITANPFINTFLPGVRSCLWVSVGSPSAEIHGGELSAGGLIRALPLFLQDWIKSASARNRRLTRRFSVWKTGQIWRNTWRLATTTAGVFAQWRARTIKENTTLPTFWWLHVLFYEHLKCGGHPRADDKLVERIRMKNNWLHHFFVIQNTLWKPKLPLCQ